MGRPTKQTPAAGKKILPAEKRKATREEAKSHANYH